MRVVFQFADWLSAIAANIEALELPPAEGELYVLVERGRVAWAQILIDLQEFVDTEEVVVAHPALDPVIRLDPLELRQKLGQQSQALVVVLYLADHGEGFDVGALDWLRNCTGVEGPLLRQLYIADRR